MEGKEGHHMQDNYMNLIQFPRIDGRSRDSDSHRLRSRCREERRLVIYSLASGLAGSGAATAVSLAATGVARIILWAAVISSVSVLAGVAYGLDWRFRRRLRNTSCPAERFVQLCMSPRHTRCCWAEHSTRSHP